MPSDKLHPRDYLLWAVFAVVFVLMYGLVILADGIARLTGLTRGTKT